jgi:outer membrane protein OmpA-like peptidoglycan-associated protein
MKKTFAAFAAVAFIAALVSCGGAQTAGPNVGAVGGADVIIKQSNQQLEKIPVTGFGYKDASTQTTNWAQWATASAPAVKSILNNVPDGYVLQVTGHADAIGPEQPEAGKPGNIALSTARAKTVYDALVAAGITSPKLTYKGVGSSQPMAGVAPTDASQRRVTFVVVKAPAAK